MNNSLHAFITPIALAALLSGCDYTEERTRGLYKCDDLIDNGRNGLIDFPYDPGCTDLRDDVEASPLKKG